MTTGRLARRLLEGSLDEPQRLLGPHRRHGRWWVRAWHPEATACEVLPGAAPAAAGEGDAVPLRPWGETGVFSGLLPEPAGTGASGGDGAPAYRLRFRTAAGHAWIEEDPYRFPSTVPELDRYLFGEGTHRGLWQLLGAHAVELEGVPGVRFATWAPRARQVSVVGDFCHWDGRRRPMRRCPESGIFELFLPELTVGDLYKFEIRAADGSLHLKTDPFAREMERPPQTASRVTRSQHRWQDDAWMQARSGRDGRGACDPRREPVAIYEVHLGSWRAAAAAAGYPALAEALVDHVRRFGFTHVELLPITEYPFDGSWGYQVSGYFAPTARYGPPDGLRAFVDRCHQAGIGVVLDWVPAHFPRDAFALRRFDGEPLYEYADPRIGEHPEWGTLVFDFGRAEVRNFLIASALYWLKEFHVDGLRVDAVASMLYRDYGRRGADWVPNVHGGNENLEAIRFLRDLNDAIHEECPGCFTAAEESTAWPGVTRSPREGGLGFDFKWNMGWMHDTLRYFSRESVHRRHHHDELTFASMYEDSESFLMPLSHDEVVHGKKSLLARMPGDRWQQFANLRLLLAYQYSRPGKKLLFMGTELAPDTEWAYDRELDWSLAEDPHRAGLARFLEELGALYRELPCLWRADPDPEGFAWIDCSDRAQSVVCYLRRAGPASCVVVLNATPVPRSCYRVGVPVAGPYRTRLSSDARTFGGSGHPVPERVVTQPVPMHGHADSLVLDLPPLGCLVLEPETA